MLNCKRSCSPLVNTTIGTVDGPVFDDAVNASGETKDGDFVAKVISRYIDKVGAENAVLVVTDNAANRKRAGETLLTSTCPSDPHDVL